MTENDKRKYNGQRQPWGTREKLLTMFGILLIAAEFVNAEVRGATFHVEFLLGGLALCGIAIAQWGDKR